MTRPRHPREYRPVLRVRTAPGCVDEIEQLYKLRSKTVWRLYAIGVGLLLAGALISSSGHVFGLAPLFLGGVCLALSWRRAHIDID